MASDQEAPSGPDLKAGIRETDLGDGEMLAGRVDGEAVLLARRGQEWFAIGAKCSHYSGPLAEGLMVGDTVRCPWHHACFSLRTGAPVRPPALNDLPTWDVEIRDGLVRVVARRTPTVTGARRVKGPESVVIVGAGVPFAAKRLGPTTGRTSPRITSPGTRRRSGFRFIHRRSTRTWGSC